MTASAWAWAYRLGLEGSLSGDEDARRIYYGVEAVKQELVARGFGDQIHLDTGRFGGATQKAAKAFQQSTTVLVDDGIVGRKTANALFRDRYTLAEKSEGIPRELLRAHCHFESGDDPGAELVNTDFSRDRGLTQANDLHDGQILSDEQAFTPRIAVPVRARSIAAYGHAFGDLVVQVQCPDGVTRGFDEWDVAVAAHRTPLGARQLATETGVVVARRRQDGGSWMEACAYYCWRVNTDGRLGWVT